MGKEFSVVFRDILDKEDIVKQFLLKTSLKRIDFSKVFKIISQNIINKYKKNFSRKYTKLNLWKSFLLDLIIYSIDYKLITEEEGDLLIYNHIDNRFFSSKKYYHSLNKFHQIIRVEKEIEYNYYLLILAILTVHKADREFINNFLDGVEESNKQIILNFLYKETNG